MNNTSDGVADAYQSELEYADELILNEDYDELLDWACEHEDFTRYPNAVVDKAIEAYRLCVEQGYPAAAYSLGAMYYRGTYLQRDYKEAFRLYKIAADGGDRYAVCALGYCYYYGRHQSPDYERAHYYYNLGATLYNDANCLYKLGDMRRDGKYVEQNAKYAVQLYFRALNVTQHFGEYYYCLPDIQMRVGTAYLEGMEVERDAARALEYLQKALSGFYGRRKTDPFVAGLIADAKEKISCAEEILDGEILHYPRE